MKAVDPADSTRRTKNWQQALKDGLNGDEHLCSHPSARVHLHGIKFWQGGKAPYRCDLRPPFNSQYSWLERLKQLAGANHVGRCGRCRMCSHVNRTMATVVTGLPLTDAAVISTSIRWRKPMPMVNDYTPENYVKTTMDWLWPQVRQPHERTLWRPRYEGRPAAKPTIRLQLYRKASHLDPVELVILHEYTWKDW